MSNNNELRPFEVLTTQVCNGVGNRFLGRHIVIATSMFIAKKAIQERKPKEEVLSAREFVDYELVIVK